MATLYLIVGIQGSGKTTLARELAEQHHAKIHSYDDIPNARRNPDKDGKIMNQWISAMNADLLAGHSVICDNTNLTSEYRKQILGRLVPCKKVLIVKAVPLEVCLHRNKDREWVVPEYQIEMALRALEPPTKDEGWEEIYVSKD